MPKRDLLLFLINYIILQKLYDYVMTNIRSTTGVTGGAGTSVPSGAPKFIPSFE